MKIVVGAQGLRKDATSCDYRYKSILSPMRDSPKDRRGRDKVLSGSPNGEDGVQRESQGR